jgi:hypothetical protein
VVRGREIDHEFAELSPLVLFDGQNLEAGANEIMIGTVAVIDEDNAQRLPGVLNDWPDVFLEIAIFLREYGSYGLPAAVCLYLLGNDSLAVRQKDNIESIGFLFASGAADTGLEVNVPRVFREDEGPVQECFLVG